MINQEIQTEELETEDFEFHFTSPCGPEGTMNQAPQEPEIEMEEVQVMGTIQLDDTNQHTANLLSAWPWNLKEPKTETLHEMIPEDQIVQPLANRLLLTMVKEGVNMAPCHSIIGPGLIFAMSTDTLNKWIDHQIANEEEDHARPEFSGTGETTQLEGPLLVKIDPQDCIQEPGKLNTLSSYSDQNDIRQLGCEGLDNEEKDIQLIWISLLEKHIKNEIQAFKEEQGQMIPQSKKEWRQAIMKMGYNGGSDERDIRIGHQIILDSLSEMGIMLTQKNWIHTEIGSYVGFPSGLFNPEIFHLAWTQITQHGLISNTEPWGEIRKQPTNVTNLKAHWDRICEELFNVRLHQRADIPSHEKQEYGDFVIECIQDSFKTIGIYLPTEQIKEEMDDGSPLHSKGMWQLAMRHIKNCVFDTDYQFNEEKTNENQNMGGFLTPGAEENLNEPPYPPGYDINFGLIGKDNYANKMRAVDDVDHIADNTEMETHTFEIGVIRHYGEEKMKQQATADMIEWTAIEQNSNKPRMAKAITKEKFIMEITPEGSEKENGVSKIYQAHAPFCKWNKIVLANQKGIIATIWVRDTTPRWEKYLGRKNKRNICQRKCCTQHKKNFRRREENTRGQRHINRLMNESINSYAGFSGKIQNTRILNQDPFVPDWLFIVDETEKKTTQSLEDSQKQTVEGVRTILLNDKPMADKIKELHLLFKISDPSLTQTISNGELNMETIYHIYRSCLGESECKGISNQPSDLSGEQEQDSNPGPGDRELTGSETFLTGMLTGVLVNFILDYMLS
jgi:hypothetical protein